MKIKCRYSLLLRPGEITRTAPSGIAVKAFEATNGCNGCILENLPDCDRIECTSTDTSTPRGIIFKEIDDSECPPLIKPGMLVELLDHTKVRIFGIESSESIHEYAVIGFDRNWKEYEVCPDSLSVIGWPVGPEDPFKFDQVIWRSKSGQVTMTTSELEEILGISKGRLVVIEG